MPFATVVGVNQHYQPILLGCVLLSQKNAGSYKWFLSNWLEAVGGIFPSAILRDQCASIRSGVKEVLPDSIHHFFLWHIVMKVGEKLKGHEEFDNVVFEFKSVV